jgi:hypothetical protein
VSDSVPTPRPGSLNVAEQPAPRPVRTASVLTVLLGISYLLGPLLAAIGLTVGGVWVVSKGGEANTLAAVSAGIWAVVLIVAAIFVWLALKLKQGRGWARLLVTILLALSAVAAVAEASADLTADPVVVPVISLLRVVLVVVTLALLWASAEAKAYFASARSG